jgi:hypothetical protein
MVPLLFSPVRGCLFTHHHHPCVSSEIGITSLGDNVTISSIGAQNESTLRYLIHSTLTLSVIGGGELGLTAEHKATEIAATTTTLKADGGSDGKNTLGAGKVAPETRLPIVRVAVDFSTQSYPNAGPFPVRRSSNCKCVFV